MISMFTNDVIPDVGEAVPMQLRGDGVVGHEVVAVLVHLMGTLSYTQLIN